LQNKTWVRDPDGNEWEAFVVLEDDLPTTTMCCTPGATEKTGATATATEAASVETAAEGSSCCGTAAPLTISR
jgi:hypothetical protein